MIASIGDGVIKGPNDGEVDIALPGEIPIRYLEDHVAIVVDEIIDIEQIDMTT